MAGELSWWEITARLVKLKRVGRLRQWVELAERAIVRLEALEAELGRELSQDEMRLLLVDSPPRMPRGTRDLPRDIALPLSYK